MSDESIKAPTTDDKILNPSFEFFRNIVKVKFSGDCLKQDIITFSQTKIVNIYIVYETERSANISSYPTLENCLFGAVKLIKHIDVDLHKYSGYGIGFDRKGFFPHPSGGTGKNVIIFGVAMSQ